MKTKAILSVCLSVLFFVSTKAADLYVNNSGQSGTYTTIQAAINAASTGDNIYVSPLNSYQESLSITKSIRIASSVSGSRIIVTKNIIISPLANILVELIGIEGTSVYLSGQTSTLGPNSRGKVIITDCSFHDLGLNTDYLTMLIVKCSLSGTLTGRHGKVIGNTIAEKIVINDEPNIGIGDSVIIKANNVTGNIEVGTDDHSVIIQNNKTSRILVSNWRAGVTISGLISNNSVISSDTYRSYRNTTTTYNTNDGWLAIAGGCINISIAATNQDVSNMLITNNYIDDLNSIPNNGGRYSSNQMNHWCAVGVSTNTPTVYPVVQYNIFDSKGYKSGSYSNSYAVHHYGFFSKVWSGDGIYNSQSEIGSSNDTQIISDGKDKGSPSPKFFDADLTRSDIGHLGGDNSWEMFHGANPISGAAYIIDLDLPSEIWPGQTVNLKAEAVHTN